MSGEAKRRRCESANGTLRCVGTEGHDHPHYADLGSGRSTRWGVVQHGCCGDPYCNREAGHDLPHRDGKGGSWWPIEVRG